jgi:hypothetical protein
VAAAEAAAASCPGATSGPRRKRRPQPHHPLAGAPASQPSCPRNRLGAGSG